MFSGLQFEKEFQVGWSRRRLAALAAIAAAAAAERPGPLHRFLPSETGRRYVPVFTPEPAAMGIMPIQLPILRGYRRPIGVG